jgi:ABC-type transporter Mla MlaB component
MLKITTLITEQQTIFKLAGALSGPWVGELNRHWQRVASFRQGVRMVDLTEVTFIDAEGEAFLTEMRRAGTELLAADCFIKAIVDRIVTSSGGPPSPVESEDRGH